MNELYLYFAGMRDMLTLVTEELKSFIENEESDEDVIDLDVTLKDIPKGKEKKLKKSIQEILDYVKEK